MLQRKLATLALGASAAVVEGLSAECPDGFQRGGCGECWRFEAGSYSFADCAERVCPALNATLGVPNLDNHHGGKCPHGWINAYATAEASWLGVHAEASSSHADLVFRTGSVVDVTSKSLRTLSWSLDGPMEPSCLYCGTYVSSDGVRRLRHSPQGGLLV